MSEYCNHVHFVFCCSRWNQCMQKYSKCAKPKHKKKSLLCWEWHVSKKLQGWVCNYHLFNWPTQFQANTVLNHLSQIFWEGKKPFTFTLTYIPSSYLSHPSHQPCLSKRVSAGVTYSITEYMNGFRMSVFATNHGPSSFIQLANARKMPGWHVNCDQETAVGFRKSYEVNKSWKISLFPVDVLMHMPDISGETNSSKEACLAIVTANLHFWGVMGV